MERPHAAQASDKLLQWLAWLGRDGIQQYVVINDR